MGKKIKLYNGDCLEVMNIMDSESIDCCVSDIPYKIVAGGVAIKDNGNECKGILNRRKAVSDGSTQGNKWVKKDGSIPCAVKSGKMFKHNNTTFDEFLPNLYRVMKKGTHTYLMINSRNLKDLQIACEKVGFVFQNLLVWDKGNVTPNQYYMQGIEFILMLSKRPARSINDRGCKNIVKIPNMVGRKIHPSQKPIELMEYLVKNSCNEDDKVLDMFMGSGSTGLACINLNRKFIGIELDKQYFKIAKDRINNG